MDVHLASRPLPFRRPALGPLTLGVLAAHVGLAAAAGPAPVPLSGTPALVVAVRVVKPAPPMAALTPVAALAPVTTAAAVPAAAAARPAAHVPARPRASAAAAPAVGAAAAAAAAAPSVASDHPTYRTQLPPSTQVRYTLTRGPWSGHGELVWSHDGDRYHARLQGRVAGVKVLTWDSTGGFDPAGLAPVRFTDERRGKSALAANFRRNLGKITYSGPDTEHPLLPGAQDRLSWMVQMAAIAAADPHRVAAGQRVSLFVTGARGDGDVWTFQGLGVEKVPVGGAAVPAIKLLREPRKPDDTRVEVWLDPALHHLPVKARLTSLPDGDTLELVRRSADPS